MDPFVVTPIDPTALVSTALDTISTGITGVAGPALVVGAGVAALTIGWRLAKRFVRG